MRGIQEKLDYLHTLGIECIYLTPIFESPSNHRYDAMDYFQIDPLLGTEADLAALIEAAHQRSMRVVLDLVANHCSNDSVYFNQSGWYGEDVGAYRSMHSPYFRMFEFERHPDKYQGWVGVRSMPEFVECPEHEAFFLGPDGVVPYWTGLGVDGWRTDVTPWMSDEFWRRVRRSLSAIDPRLLLIAEAWDNASHYLVGDSYHATMNYRFAWAALGFFALEILSVAEFVERLDELRRDTPPPALLAQVNLVSSHDTARILTRADGNALKVRQLFAFMLAYPGSPMLYYGEEAGLEGAFAEDGRRAFPWGHENNLTLDFVRGALAARQTSAALRLGDFNLLYRDERTRTVVFQRRSNEEVVIAAFNAGNVIAEVALPLTADIGAEATWRDALNWNAEATSADGLLKLQLAAHSAAWYQPITR
ncbi:MAG: glycoside hydrolase family 13 protein [Pleurocapsa minor GSE-CHR-MK-17-07R]|nr:glycoside hydrolase family 13 protein [Pleurocapsa minor GSE-CHR-MK 17-07R]